MKKLWKRFMAWWMPIAEAIGHFMNRVFLSVFYFVIVLPFGLAVRLFADPLNINRDPQTGWSEFSDRASTVEKGRLQY